MAQTKDLNVLVSKQQKLSLNLIDFDLDGSWNFHWLIGNLRKDIIPMVEARLQSSDIPFDPQDLEHQILFYLTTFSPGEITNRVIEEAVEQQYLIIRDRLVNSMTTEELNYLFRGLKLFYPDLNIKYRLKLEKKGEKIFAVGEGRSFEVEFKQVYDPKIISCFTGGLHYIHQERVNGDTFGFFFKGDRYP